MVADLLFVAQATQVPELLSGNGGAQELVISHSDADVAGSQIQGSRVWILLSERLELRLLGVAIVASVLSEDVDSESRICLLLDPELSIRTFGSLQPRLDWRVDASFPSRTGLYQCSVAEKAKLLELLRCNQAVSDVPFQPIFDDAGWHPKHGSARPSSALRTVASRVSIDSISASSHYRELSPIAAEVLRTLPVVDGDAFVELRRLLATLDPVRTLIASHQQAAPRLSFDADLQVLSRDHIRARRFRGVSDISPARQFQAQLLTERAEALHQAGVVAVVEALAGRGVKALSSRSVDLAFVDEAGLVVVEVKSANERNAVDQALGGIAQLVYYRAELVAVGRTVSRLVLVFVRQGNFDFPPGVFRACHSVGISVRVLCAGSSGVVVDDQFFV